MYCSSCGVVVTEGLSYCNHCGAKLRSEKGDSLVKTTELRAESLVISAMVGLFVLGLLAITILMGVMKAVLNLNEGLIVAFALMSFLIMLILEGVLISRLPRRHRGDEERGETSSSKVQATKELDGAQARVLAEGMPSVTEEATRAFEPIYNERASK